MSTKTLVFFLLSQSFLISSCHVDNKLQESNPPNIIVIYADDLGWSDVGYNNQTVLYETPNIDKIAKEGMIFNRFYPSAANCAPSRACMLTGMYAPRHGVYIPQGLARGGDISKMRWKVPTLGADSSFNTFPVSINRVAPEFESLAELLSKGGYATARFGKWHIGDDNQGFDVNSADGVMDHVTNIGGKEKRYYTDTLVAQKLTDAAIDFITQNKNKPFFLYLAHWEVHGPMAASEERIEYYRDKIKREHIENANPVYAAEVEQLDISTGRIIASLENLNLDDNTIVIFTSDNGGVSGITSNNPLRAGKGTYYEGGIRTPYCMKWPGVIKPGSVSDIPISGVDLMPTFAEVAYVSLPENQPVDGQSLVPILKDKLFDKSRSLFFHFPLYLGSGGKDNVLPTYDGQENYWRAVPLSVIINNDWKLIYYYEYDKYELFNLKNDISESSDLSSEYKVKAKELIDELSSWTKSVQAPIPEVLNNAE